MGPKVNQFGLEDWEVEAQRYYQKLFDDGKYRELCEEFCHEGLNFRRGPQIAAFVCSMEFEAPTYTEALHGLAKMVIEKVREGQVGC